MLTVSEELRRAYLLAAAKQPDGVKVYADRHLGAVAKSLIAQRRLEVVNEYKQRDHAGRFRPVFVLSLREQK